MATPRRSPTPPSPTPPSTIPRGSDPESELPSVLARVLAFGSVLLGGAAGALIGYAFAELGGFEGAAGGAVTLLSALVGAGGVAVVAVLTLRAFGEWHTIRSTGDPGAARSAGRPDR
ncbi:MAG: hypothetical protein V9E94_13690 [Microthrixaceae bacterium]